MTAVSSVEVARADPQLAVRGAEPLVADRGGPLAGAARRAGGRPATSTATRRRRCPSRAFTRGVWEELELVNLIRERLAQWREQSYPGVTRTTLELLRHWRREGGSSGSSSRSSRRPRRSSSSPRRAATCSRGSTSRPTTGRRASAATPARWRPARGKTTVMAMLIAWSILNKVAARGDARFSDVVLVVCPNVTIRNRLARARPERGRGIDLPDARPRPAAPDAAAPQGPRARQELARVRAQGDERRREGAAQRRARDDPLDDQDRREDDLGPRRALHDREGARARGARRADCGSSRTGGRRRRRCSSRRRATSRATRR